MNDHSRGQNARDEPTVNVRATAVVDAVPDEAHIHFDLTAGERSAEGALDAVRERMAELEAVLDELGVERDDRTSSVRVGEQGERDGGKWLTKGYRAFSSIDVVVRDRESVGRLVNEAVDRVGPEIRGPYWRVSPDHPARLEACGKAAERARAKAEAYASALGHRLGEIVRVAEPGARTIEPTSFEVAAEPMSGASPRAPLPAPAAAEAKPVLDLRPGTQEVHAGVELIFRLERP